MVRSIDIKGREFDALTVSDDGAWLAGGDHAGAYTVWNTATGARQMHVQLPYYPFALAFSPDARRLAIAPAGEPVQVYDPAAGRKLFELQRVTGGTAALAFSRDGSRIVAADTDTVVRVYEARNGELLSRNTDFLLVPLAAAFSADGKQVLAGGGDKVLAVIDAATGRVQRKSAKLADPVGRIALSPDGALYASVLMHADNMNLPAPVLIAETATGKQVQEWTPKALPAGGEWTSDGRLLVAMPADKGAQVWRIR
jgi:WD40 repeat protein